MHMYKGLHILDAPFMTLLSGSSAGVLLLEVLFLESISPIYIIRILAMMSICRKETHQLTNTVPSKSRLNSEAVGGRRWTRIFGFARAL